MSTKSKNTNMFSYSRLVIYMLEFFSYINFIKMFAPLLKCLARDMLELAAVQILLSCLNHDKQ